MIGLPLIIVAASSACTDSIHSSHDNLTADCVQPYQDSTWRFSDLFMSVNSNIVPWAAGIINAELQLRLKGQFSIAVPVWWSPYFISRSHALRTLAIQPELRYWLKETGSGHFFGVHPGIAWYNLRFNDIRYQDSGMPLMNIGITYGYSLRLNHSLFAEFSIGAGYVRTKYDRFYNISNGAKIDSRATNYWGIDRLELSISYHFNP